GQADLGDGQEPAGVDDQALDPLRRPVALLDELVDPCPADGHEGDLGRHEDALEEGQDDDDEELEGGVHQASLAPPGASPAAAFGGRGSRILAGTPTASLPGGTSFVTT